PPCVVTMGNPRTVRVTVGVAHLHFAVECGSVGGTLTVETATRGALPDWNGYLLLVTGYPERRVGINDTVRLEPASRGQLSVTLGDLAANCATTGPTTLAVTMADGDSARVRFEVSCSGVGEGVILFTNYGLPHVYRVGVDGSNLADLTPSGAACCGDWSPDGARIVYGGETGLTVMNQDGSDPTPLGLMGAGPRWSPDGSRLVFTVGTTISVANADGTDAVALTSGEAPDWSPDGRQIAFHRRGDCSVVMCGADVFLMDANGTDVRRVTNSSGWGEFYGYPAWSPDGGRIAVRHRAFLRADGIDLIHLPGGSRVGLGARRPTMNTPVWSPDGSAIAYSEFVGDLGTRLAIVPSSGGTSVVLTGVPSDVYPTSWK
ncbi:MAG TPA: hypothetical protein VFR62_00140, partial [Gemmatimonadales bacterium]|nr:hypothetical protein [Gemmatimonadales bacterium]